MKVRKIRNIEKNVCFAEQKIAYNYAFFMYDDLKKAKEKCPFIFQFDEVLNDAIDNIKKSYDKKEEMKKYNLDAIIVCFRNGIHNGFLENFILWDYEDIGKMFSFPYTIE